MSYTPYGNESAEMKTISPDPMVRPKKDTRAALTPGTPPVTSPESEGRESIATETWRSKSNRDFGHKKTTKTVV
jgi:hypothetical protein